VGGRSLAEEFGRDRDQPWRSAAEPLQIRPRHQPDQLLEGRLRLPAQLALGLAVVADQVVDLGGA
jgi:hypothetical protein